MKRVIRLALVVSAAAVSLAFTSSAWASYSPSLTVTASNNKPGAATSLLLGHIQSAADDPTAKDTIYAPLGYGVNLSQAPGTKIGDVSATLILRNGGNAEVAVDGRVVADNPANHPNDQCALDVNGVFSNPANTTDRIWRATFTPYVAGTPQPNPAGTTEGQAVVPGRVGLTMATKSLKHGVVVVSGRLTVDGQAFGGGLVELYKGSKRIGKARTKGNGNYTIRIKIKKKTRVLAQVLFLGDLPGCPAPPLPGVPQGCKTGSLSFFAFKIGTARRKK